MNKKYIISGIVGCILLSFTTAFALTITKPTITDPVFKAVYIGGPASQSALCASSSATFCMDQVGFYRNEIPGANNNILKWNNGTITIGELTSSDIPDNIITATHILDRSVLTRKFNPESITLPTYGSMIESNNTCGKGETAVGISGGNMVCVQVDFLNSQEWLPNCGSSGGGYTLVGSGIQYVSGGVTVYGYKWECKSNVINVLGADGGDMNWSGSSTGNIGNKNIGNVGVGLTNPAQTLTVQDSLNINGMGEKILCMRTDEYVDIDTYNEDYCAKCDVGYTYNSTTKVCEKGCAMCAGTGGFPNATLCTGDDAYVPAGSSYSLIGGGPEACINNSNKCKYFCDPGFIKVGEECLKCQEGTYTTGSNACILEAKCDNAAYDSILTGTAGVGSGIYTVCALRGNCYAGYNPSQGVFGGGPTLFPVYNNTTRERVVIKEPFLPKNLGKAARKYIANSGDMLPNSCHYTCAKGYFLSTDMATCEPPRCDVWWKTSATDYVGNAGGALARGSVLSGTTKYLNYWSFLDATDSADFYNKINNKDVPYGGCFFWCENPTIGSDGMKICPPKPTEPTEPELQQPYCTYRYKRGEIYLQKPTTYDESRQYTGFDAWVGLYNNNISSGCWYSCDKNNGAIKSTVNDSCIPKCNMTREYMYSGSDYYYCALCSDYGIATGPIVENGNNSRCIYKCPADHAIYSDYSPFGCTKCDADKMGGGSISPNGNYTECIPKCDYHYGLYYDLITNSCLPANTTGTCPSGFDEKIIDGVKKCVRCPSSSYHWDESAKTCVLN